MKKIFKFMMMALVATVMTIGFAACSSDDEETLPNTYALSIGSSQLISTGGGITEIPGRKVMQQIEAAYNEVGITSSFTASSDAEVKAKAQQAEAKLTNIDWTGTKGSIEYFIMSVRSQQKIYSKTFSSSDSGSNAIK